MQNTRRSASSVIGQSRRGTVLVAVIVLLLLAELIVFGLVISMGEDQSMTIDRADTVRAFYAAEAGLRMGTREVFLSSDEDEDGIIGTISDDGDPDNDPMIGTAKLYVRRGTVDNMVTIVSLGRAGGTKRMVFLQLQAGGSGTSPGLVEMRYSNIGSVSSLDQINWSAFPDSTGIAYNINIDSTISDQPAWPGGPNTHWGKKYSGNIIVPEEGNWTFYLESDEGSRLSIDGVDLIDNDGLHMMRKQSNSISLTAGSHDITILWFEQTGSHGLIASWRGPTVPAEEVIPSSVFKH